MRDKGDRSEVVELLGEAFAEVGLLEEQCLAAG